MPDIFRLKNERILVNVESPGGIYNSKQLAMIAEVASKDLAIVKATEDQRICLFIKPEDREDLESSLGSLGLLLTDYQNGLQSPSTCIGELCEFHQQDASGVALAISEKIENVDLDVAFKIAVNGCDRCCVPCHTKDISLIGEASGFRFSIGGKSSYMPEVATYLAESVPSDGVADYVVQIVNRFKDDKQQGEMFYDYIERVGSFDFIKALEPYSQDARAEGGLLNEENHVSLADSADSLEAHNEEMRDIPLVDDEDGLLAESPLPDASISDAQDDDDDLQKMDEMLLDADETGEFSDSQSQDAGKIGELSPRELADTSDQPLDESELPSEASSSELLDDTETISNNDESFGEVKDEMRGGDIADEPLDSAAFLGESDEFRPEAETDLDTDAVQENDLDASQTGNSSSLEKTKADEVSEKEDPEKSKDFLGEEFDSLDSLDEDSERQFEEKLSDSIEEEAESHMLDEADQNSDERLQLLSMLEGDSSKRADDDAGAQRSGDDNHIFDEVAENFDQNSEQESSVQRKRGGGIPNHGQKSGHMSLSSFELLSGGLIHLTFDSGASVDVDLSRLEEDREKIISLGAQPISLCKHTAGITIDIDGVKIYYPFSSVKTAS